VAPDHVTTQPGVEQQLVTELAALVLEQTAPEELAVLSETAQEYFADPQAVLDPKRRDEALGFGLEVALLGPYILAVAIPVVKYLASIVADGMQDAATPLVADLVRRLFRRRGDGAAPPAAGDPAPPPPTALTADQGRLIRDATYERALALSLPDVQAGVLADAVAGGLITRS